MKLNLGLQIEQECKSKPIKTGMRTHYGSVHIYTAYLCQNKNENIKIISTLCSLGTNDFSLFTTILNNVPITFYSTTQNPVNTNLSPTNL